MKESNIRKKSFAFALSVVKLCQYLHTEKEEFVMSNQLLRSGTCIGARIIVAEHSQSKKELVDRLSIAQKEINETIYWLELLRNTGNITAEQFETMHDSALEMVEIIAVIFTNTKLNNELNIIAHNPTSNN